MPKHQKKLKKILFCNTVFRKVQKSLKSTSDEWLYAISLSYCLLGILVIKQCISVSCNMFRSFKTFLQNKKTVSFLPLRNNSVTTKLSFSLASISAIISSKTINILSFLFGLYSSMFHSIFKYLIKTLEYVKGFNSLLSCLFIKNW